MALCCSWVCWCWWEKDPTYTAKSCSLVRQCLEMGRFHSSLLRLLLTCQVKACWPYLRRLPSWHSASSWNYAKFHHSGVALGSHLQRGQVFWDQCFDEDSTILFQEPLCNKAWWDVHTCSTNSSFPVLWVLMKQGVLLSKPSNTLCRSWRS